MRAVVCPRYGPPEVLRIEERPSPEPRDGEARVRVEAAAVNFPDVLLIGGNYQISVPPPFVPGSEFAGVVEEVNEAGGEFRGGDRVVGTVLCGAFAEQVVVPTARLTRVPSGVDARAAAAFGVAYRTAYHSLRSAAQVQAADEVIVLGAGGGVGLAAVQLAVVLGAEVTAVASSAEKLAAAASYGARHVINYRCVDLRAALRRAVADGAHAVIDPVGGELSEPALRSLRRGGRFVTLGYASGVIPRIPLNLVLMKGVHVLGFQFGDLAPEDFRRNEVLLRDLQATGRVAPHIGARFSFDRTADALRLVADGAAIGKVVIDVKRKPNTVPLTQ